jgi:hypothetical protein
MPSRQAVAVASAPALPPPNGPLSAMTVVDHRAPPGEQGVSKSKLPDMTVTRFIRWRNVPLTLTVAFWSQVTLPEMVATPEAVFTEAAESILKLSTVGPCLVRNWSKPLP